VKRRALFGTQRPASLNCAISSSVQDRIFRIFGHLIAKGGIMLKDRELLHRVETGTGSICVGQKNAGDDALT
jgi:hypothetical protein